MTEDTATKVAAPGYRGSAFFSHPIAELDQVAPARGDRRFILQLRLAAMTFDVKLLNAVFGGIR